MSKRNEFTLTVKLKSPFLFQGLSVARLGLDASALRDEEDRPIIPADHLRGLMREACGYIGMEEPQINELFGQASKENSRDEPRRGNLIFSDLSADTKGSENIHTRIAIDEDSGTVKTGALQVIELVAPFAEHLTFSGSLIAFCDNARTLEGQLQKALKLIPYMGAFRSVGFGEVVKTSLCENKDTSPPATGTLDIEGKERACFEITFDRPLLVDCERTAENVFKGQTIIPGATLKGALAQKLIRKTGKLEDKLDKALSSMTISHAFALDETGRILDRPLPCSLASNNDPTKLIIHDKLRAGKDDMLVNGKAPFFVLDWKGPAFKAAQEKLNRPPSDIPALPRGRTAIGAGSVAEDEKLFVTIARGALKQKWRFCIERNGADESEFKALVEAIWSGLDDIGRTGASLKSIKQVEPPARTAKPLKTNHWAVMLETPAVMTDPFDTRPVADQYQDYFHKASGVDVKLINHFAQRELAGGYIAVRRRAFGKNIYHPFEVTQPGAVFLLEGDLQCFFEQKVKTGLPALRSSRSDESGDWLEWDECPYVPENGYGEISADPDIFTAFAEVSDV